MINLFSPLIFIYTFLIVVPIILKVEQLIDLYVALVTVIVVVTFSCLSRYTHSKMVLTHISSEESDLSIKNLGTLPVFSLVIFFIYMYIVDIDISMYAQSFSLADKYENRLTAISVPLYSLLFKNVITIIMALSLLFILRGRYLIYVFSLLIIFSFYALSNEKYPLLLYIAVSFWFCYRSGLLNFKSSLLFIAIVACLLAYIIKVTISQDFGLDSLVITVDALVQRMNIISDLILFSYHQFANGPYLYGATFPEFFGIIPLNLSSHDTLNISHYLMSIRTGELGGANASFITEGFINFGYGFDFLFVLVVSIWTLMTLRIGYIILSHNYFIVFQLCLLFLLCDLINSNMWLTIHGSAVILLILWFNQLLTKMKIYNR